jgi:hypothetical protein
MTSKPPFLLADAIENWRLGIVVATIVLALLVAGLLTRAPYIAEAKVDIGGVSSVSENSGVVRFQPFETAEAVEDFFSRYVLVNSPFNAGNSCSAAATYSPDGLRLKLLCRGKSENQIREMILSSLKPLLDRHANFYALAEKYYGKRLYLIEREIREREKIVNLLRKTPTSVLSEMNIIEQQIIIERLREREAFERLLGGRVRPSRFEEANIAVVDRRPGLKVWVVVLLLSLGSFLFVAAVSQRLKRIEA